MWKRMAAEGCVSDEIRDVRIGIFRIVNQRNLIRDLFSTQPAKETFTHPLFA